MPSLKDKNSSCFLFVPGQQSWDSSDLRSFNYDNKGTEHNPARTLV